MSTSMCVKSIKTWPWQVESAQYVEAVTMKIVVVIFIIHNITKIGHSVLILWNFVVVQSLSCVLLFATPWTAAHQAPCPSLSPRACSNSGPLSWWCHPTTSSSVIPFSSCLQSFSECVRHCAFNSHNHPVKRLLKLSLCRECNWLSSQVVQPGFKPSRGWEDPLE